MDLWKVERGNYGDVHTKSTYAEWGVIWTMCSSISDIICICLAVFLRGTSDGI
jgi:hypothetical protein